MGFAEFVSLVAAMMATQAIAIDAMLPAFPLILADLHVANPNHGQWILTAYMTGLGAGQLIWGLLSDRFGRRPLLLGGLGLYVAAALLCGLTSSFHALLAFRFLHGVAAATVTVSRSMIRDLYSGRPMARVMSLTFLVFLLAPVLAPTAGQFILSFAPWRAIFWGCGVFGVIVWLWAWLRLDETLHAEYRLVLSPERIGAAVRLVIGNRISLCYTLASTIVYGSLMAYIGMVQQIFSDVYHRPRLMPSMFALCASSMGIASFLNSRFVERLGMRLISHWSLIFFIAVSAVHVIFAALRMEPLWLFVCMQATTMAFYSLSVSNFGSMAMEPMGSVAGVGASLQGFTMSVGGAFIGALVGRYFDGTTVPITLGSLVCGVIGLGLVLLAERGRLFRQRHVLAINVQDSRATAR